jgi:hypothetical protein
MFEGFEFPVIKGLEYLINENVPETDFLLINEPSTDFSLMFEKDFPIFKVPENTERDYCLFELKRSDRVIKFFCPEKHKNIDTAVWYFYVDLFDENGAAHTLPGQVRVEFDGNVLRQVKGKPQFIEVLERVKLTSAAASA